MDDSPLKAALKKLLAHGDAATDSKLMKMKAAKAVPGAEEAACPKCGAQMDEGDPAEPDKCPKCGFVQADTEDDGDADLASTLERGGLEG